MSIQVKSNFNPKRMAEEIKERHQNALEKALAKAVREINKRTLGGTDADGAAFAPYTPEYAAYKSGFTKTGKNRKTRSKKTGNLNAVKPRFGAGTVNLAYSGDMLQSMQTTFSRDANGITGYITFSSAEAAAKAKGNMKKRKFFALSDEQLKQITDAIRNAK